MSASFGPRGPPTSHHGRERTKGASTSLAEGLWSVISIKPFIRRLPVHGGWHSLSVSTKAFGTFSAPRSSSWTGLGGDGGVPDFVFGLAQRVIHLLPHEAAREHLAGAAGHREIRLDQHEVGARGGGHRPRVRRKRVLEPQLDSEFIRNPPARRAARWEVELGGGGGVEAVDGAGAVLEGGGVGDDGARRRVAHDADDGVRCTSLGKASS